MEFEKEEFERDSIIFYVKKDKYDHYQITKATVRWKRDYGFMNVTHYYIHADLITLLETGLNGTINMNNSRMMKRNHA